MSAAMSKIRVMFMSLRPLLKADLNRDRVKSAEIIKRKSTFQALNRGHECWTLTCRELLMEVSDEER
jgi:hypothetical protein